MSEEGHAAPTAPRPGAAPQVDPVEELAKRIFVELSGHVYSRTDGAKPDPKAVVAISFKLAEAFMAGNLQFNTAARQRAEAKAKASVDVSKIEIDFGSVGAGAKK